MDGHTASGLAGADQFGNPVAEMFPAPRSLQSRAAHAHEIRSRRSGTGAPRLLGMVLERRRPSRDGQSRPVLPDPLVPRKPGFPWVQAANLLRTAVAGTAGPVTSSNARAKLRPAGRPVSPNRRTTLPRSKWPRPACDGRICGGLRGNFSLRPGRPCQHVPAARQGAHRRIPVPVQRFGHRDPDTAAPTLKAVC